MTMFVATNQAFFMGFFFFLSAYFTRASYDRKGPAKFVKDRLVRLGIPLLFYSFVLSPILSYLVYYFAQEHHISYWAYLSGFNGWIDFGVLWFVEALLLFTLLYVVWRSFWERVSSERKAPGVRVILLFALGVGVVSFLVRVIFPVGWVLRPLGFQFGHFSQYVALFVLGIVASGNDWLNRLSDKTGKRLGWVVLLLILFFPVFYLIKEKLDMPLAWYSGGFHWQSLLYAVWEQVIGFSLIVALLAWPAFALCICNLYLSSVGADLDEHGGKELVGRSIDQAAGRNAFGCGGKLFFGYAGDDRAGG